MTTRLPILLVGAGGHARACIDVVEQSGAFSVFGLTGLPEQVGFKLLGYPVLGTDADLASLRDQVGHALVVVGQIKSPQVRVDLFNLLERRKFVLPTVISARAYVSPHATVGEGSIVMHGAVVNAGARVGRNCILNSQALVEHDAVVGDHCHISTGALINGGAQVGAGSFVGSGSMVRESIHIGERCVIGMGQRILRDCTDHARIPDIGSEA